MAARTVKTEAAASAGGARFGAWRMDPAAPGQGVVPMMVGALALWLLAAMLTAAMAGVSAGDDGQWRPRRAAV